MGYFKNRFGFDFRQWNDAIAVKVGESRGIQKYGEWWTNIRKQVKYFLGVKSSFDNYHQNTLATSTSFDLNVRLADFSQ